MTKRQNRMILVALLVLGVSFAGYLGIKAFNEYLLYESEHKLLTLVFLVIVTFLVYIITSIFTKAFKISDIKLKY